MHKLPRLNGCGASSERQYIVCYLLTKYFSILTSRFSAISLWLNSCHMGMCWHDCARIHPNIDNSRNAIYPICRGWMAAGYQMKGNIVFYLLRKYFSNITSRFSAMQVSIKTGCPILQNQNHVYGTFSRCFQRRQMHKLPRLNGCGVSSERQYCLLSADEIFLKFNEPFFGNISLTKLLSYGDVLAWLRKNTS